MPLKHLGEAKFEARYRTLAQVQGATGMKTPVAPFVNWCGTRTTDPRSTWGCVPQRRLFRHNIILELSNVFVKRCVSRDLRGQLALLQSVSVILQMSDGLWSCPALPFLKFYKSGAVQTSECSLAHPGRAPQSCCAAGIFFGGPRVVNQALHYVHAPDCSCKKRDCKPKELARAEVTYEVWRAVVVKRMDKTVKREENLPAATRAIFEAHPLCER